ENTLSVVADAYFNQLAPAKALAPSLKKEHTVVTAEAIQHWIEQWLRLEFKLPPTQISSHKTFVDYGVDSVSATELAAALEAEIKPGLKLESALFWDHPTISGFSKHLSSLINQASSELPSLDSKLDSDAHAASAYEQIPQLFNRATHRRNRQVFIEGRWICDFASCNYLGLDLHPQVQQAILPAIREWGTHSGWTRAVASPDLYSELEAALSTLLKVPDTLVFPSVSALHMGVIPILAGKSGTIFIDDAAHRSIVEACRLAKQHGAQVVGYRHSDLADLSSKLTQHSEASVKLIVIDGVYSMSSNYADLPAYVSLAKQFDATVYVDDAHGFGIVGENPTPAMPYGHRGNGIVNYYGLRYEEDRIIYCAGLSKAFSSYGAFVTCGDAHMRKRLATAWTAVFSGPSPVASLASAIAGLKINQTEGDRLRQRIYDLTRKLIAAARDIGFEVNGQRDFPIVSVVVGSIESAIVACKILWEHGILITPGIFPAVPKSRSLLRFSITAANTECEIDQAIVALRAVYSSLAKAQNLK
ncbi:aminotransferase class I/II-fold pyridoxal phosphate-dependent enzyme, partial [cf. Phormidesmis sp. LEGE 11477]|uniref:aminotransferase class I/II-fold pyridoxal phosphate-dependent enzyme n=1 Tax=cf. Phormidesmis sp. LEGE 11477 TaxID=1828680 RepID=UPI001882D974